MSTGVNHAPRPNNRRQCAGESGEHAFLSIQPYCGNKRFPGNRRRSLKSWLALPDLPRFRWRTTPQAPTAPNGGAYRLDCAGQDDLRPAVFHAVTQRRWVLRELHSERKSLEDAFAVLTENVPGSN